MVPPDKRGIERSHEFRDARRRGARSSNGVVPGFRATVSRPRRRSDARACPVPGRHGNLRALRGRTLPGPSGRPPDGAGDQHAGRGLDVVLNDPAIAEACRAATAIVLQVQGAQNLSNRLYTVHPRRNDRFVRASAMLRTIYRDVDFTEFHFTRHMLDHLRTLSPDRFAIVRHELRLAWLARMQRFLSDVPAPVHLLWLSCRAPQSGESRGGLGEEPLFITSDMLEEVVPQAASLSVVAVPNAQGKPVKGPMAAARILPSPEAHQKAAVALARVLETR